MPGAQVVRLLVLIVCKPSRATGAGQREAGGQGTDTAGVAGKGVQRKLEPVLEGTQLVLLYSLL